MKKQLFSTFCVFAMIISAPATAQEGGVASQKTGQGAEVSQERKAAKIQEQVKAQIEAQKRAREEARKKARSGGESKPAAKDNVDKHGREIRTQDAPSMGYGGKRH